MDDLKYNSEGCGSPVATSQAKPEKHGPSREARHYDPVVYEALTKIEREEWEARRKAAYRPLVYICSPYAGDVEKNTFRARAFSRFAVEKKYIPIAPHLLCPHYLDEETERWLGLKMGIVFMGKCEEVWVFGNVISEGMEAEIEKAKRMRKKIRYFTEDLVEVSE